MNGSIRSILPVPDRAVCDIIGCDDVRRIFDCRLRWYGLDHIVVDELRRADADTIAVTVRDRRSNRSYRISYRTTLSAPERRPAAHPMAA